MIFKIGEYGNHLTWSILILVFFVFILRVKHDSDYDLSRLLDRIIGVLVVIWVMGLGYDQYVMQRAHDFSIPSTELSERELTYREEEVNRLREEIDAENKAEELDKMIKEIQQENK